MAASLKLLFKKLKITVEELNTLRENSLAFTKASARKFEKLSRETNIDVKNLLANASPIGYDLTNSFLQPRSSPVPPPIVDTFINPDSVYKYGQDSIHAEGEGDGIITQEWGGNAYCHAHPVFLVMPTKEASHRSARLRFLTAFGGFEMTNP